MVLGGPAFHPVLQQRAVRKLKWKEWDIRMTNSIIDELAAPGLLAILSGWD